MQNASKNQKIKHQLMCVKIAVRDFIVDELWVYLIVFGSIAIVSWIFDKWIEGIMLCVSHTVIRALFNKQFHFNKVAYCLMLTLAVIWVAIPTTFSIEISLLSSIPIAFLISFFGFLAQDRFDYMEECKKLQAELDKLIVPDVYKMSEDELRKYCIGRNLSEIQIDIVMMRIFDNLKISEICKYRHYGRTTIKYHITQIKNKLGLDKI